MTIPPEHTAFGDGSGFHDAVPKLRRSEELFTRGVAAFAWMFGLYWIIWRWSASLNHNAIVFSVLLVLAETWGLLNSFLLLATVWKLRNRETSPAPEGLAVDVFITCYDEPLEVLRRTGIGARAIRYPHQTYFLDDGKRDEVKAMAEALGVGYIRREGNEHAKAGNLNHALTVTSGEFILQLDADHVALPNMLDALLGYFGDEKVAFVQSPQDFYNTDSFTHVVNDEGRRLWEENRVFFSLLQPGKDTWNAAFFCGSCGVLRRKAFEEIGGFSIQTITEDMETSMVLHSRGWRSVYHGETLAYGLAPSSAAAYHVQRLRWGQGSMQILRKMNPLTYKGLSIPQRLAYFSSVSTYLDGVQKLIFYLAPVVFFLTGVLPVNVTNWELLTRLVPYVLLTVFAFEMMSRGTGWILISERYNMAKFWTYVLACSGFFAKKPLKFNVTPKGIGEAVPFNTYAPQLYLLIASIASVIWATIANHYGWIDYHASGWSSLAFWLNGFWILWNIYFAGYVVLQSRNATQQRIDHRFADAFPINVIVEGSEHPTEPVVALTQDLNPSGLSFRSAERLAPGTKVSISLPLASGTFDVSGSVMHVEMDDAKYTNFFKHGVQFGETPIATLDAIELHVTHHSIPMWRMKYRQSINLFSRVIESVGNVRGQKRRLVQLPARVVIEANTDEPEASFIALLEDVSKGGARLLMETPIEPGRIIRYEVPSTEFFGRGTVVFNRSLESPMRTRFVVGVAILKPRRLGWSNYLSRKRSAVPVAG